MKKLFSALLALVMVFSLTVPALAAETGQTPPLASPGPDDDYYANWAKEGWAETCAVYPKETALFLAEFPTWFAEYYSKYESLEDYVERRGYSCAEGAYLDLYDVWSRAYEQEQARRDFITSHGGVPGQTNVMVNGKCLTAPAQRPTYVKNGTTYVDAQTLSQALGTEVKANSKGYARLRSAAKAAGCKVWWDEEYCTAVVLDPAALAEQIDESFTIYNKVLAQDALTDKTQRSVGSGKLDFTLFDTMDGDKTGKASYSYDLSASRAGASGKVEYDLSDLWSILEGYIPAPLPEEEGSEETAQVLAMVKSLMQGKAEFRMDLDKELLYFSMPGLFEAMNGYMASSGVQLPQDCWLSLSLEGVGLDKLTGKPGQTPTVGSILCASCMPVSGRGAAKVYDNILEVAGRLAGLAGDARFTRTGGADVLTLTKEDLLVLVEEDSYTAQSLDAVSQFDYTLTVKDNGDLDADYQARMALASSGISLGDMAAVSAKSSRRGGKTEATVEYHMKNAFKMTVTLEQTLTETDRAPELDPPQDTLILPMDGLAGGSSFTPAD